MDSINELKQRALDLHRKYITIDAHCDTIMCLDRGEHLGGPGSAGHVDLKRLKASGVKLVFMAVCVERNYTAVGGLHRALHLIDHFFEECKLVKEQVRLVRSREDITRIMETDEIGFLLTIEGGEPLEEDLSVLRLLERLGVRGIGLTWNNRNALAGGIWEERTPGLSNFGESVVRELNRLHMLVDVAHLSEPGFWDVMEVSSAPVICSHANAFSLCPHKRNLKDTQLKALASSGGMIGVTFVPDFVDGGNPTLDRLVDHIVHLCTVMGANRVGLGSDFDGTDALVPGLEDCASLPNLTAAMLSRGFQEDEVAGILGRNWLHLLEDIIT